jgi:hypothetical protein
LTSAKRKRGRPSAGDLTAPALDLGATRRQPLPPELHGDEAEAFLLIVNSEEAGWFSPASVPLLTQYCRHIVQARRLAELMEKAVGDPETTFEYYERLLKEQRGESAALVTLATKLRLSPQSLRNDRGNRIRPPGPVPWETI